jgi:hypothetical protein
MPLMKDSVDLQPVDGQAAEVGQRRVAGAEVVDGKAHPELAQALHHLERGFHALHEGGLGDLQRQVGRRQAWPRPGWS